MIYSVKRAIDPFFAYLYIDVYHFVIKMSDKNTLHKPFRAKPHLSGHSFVITVPSYLIRAEIIKPELLYNVRLEPVED